MQLATILNFPSGIDVVALARHFNITHSLISSCGSFSVSCTREFIMKVSFNSKLNFAFRLTGCGENYIISGFPHRAIHASEQNTSFSFAHIMNTTLIFANILLSDGISNKVSQYFHALNINCMHQWEKVILAN